jgi:hypothetical protein
MAKTSSDDTKRDVHQCVLAVMKLMGRAGISKDSVNEGQRFNFRGIDDALNALNGPLTAAGLVIYPSVKSVDRTERATKSGGSMTNTVLTVEYRLVSTHDGSEFTVQFAGEASDSGDKGVSKALSMSFKYMLFQTFCIPVEGMDDSDSVTPPASVPAKAPSKPQAARKAAEATDAPAEEEEATEEPTEPANDALTFEGAVAALEAVTTADQLAALKPKLAVFAKHKSFTKTMKPLFVQKTAETAQAAE